MTFNPQPKQGKPKNGTAAGRRHMNRVKQLDCVVCGKSGPSQAHHCRSGGMMRDDFKTIPLCYECHQGDNGYHADKRNWQKRNGPDYGFIKRVLRLLGIIT